MTGRAPPAGADLAIESPPGLVEKQLLTVTSVEYVANSDADTNANTD
jgi:hypothetical protein